MVKITYNKKDMTYYEHISKQDAKTIKTAKKFIEEGIRLNPKVLEREYEI